MQAHWHSSNYEHDIHELHRFQFNTSRDWRLFTFLGGLYFPNRTTSMVYSTYYVLAKRGNILMTNALVVKDTLSKIYSFFRHQPQSLRWVFTFRHRQTNLARWFAWETDSDAYIQVSRDLVVFAVQENVYMLRSRYLSYNFLYFLGCDVAFVFTSFADDGRYLDFRDKGIPTIGFDGGHHSSIYTYGLPGGLNSSTVLIYARVLASLLNEVRQGHWFWTLASSNFII